MLWEKKVEGKLNVLWEYQDLCKCPEWSGRPKKKAPFYGQVNIDHR
jgi:hypothetical protein